MWITSCNALFTEPRREISASCQCKNFVIPSLGRKVRKENNSFVVLRGIRLPSKNYVSQVGSVTTISCCGVFSLTEKTKSGGTAQTQGIRGGWVCVIKSAFPGCIYGETFRKQPVR